MTTSSSDAEGGDDFAVWWMRNHVCMPQDRDRYERLYKEHKERQMKNQAKNGGAK